MTEDLIIFPITTATEGKVVAEYGGTVRFANCDYIDRKGNQILCSCGKVANGGLIGKRCYIDLCYDCMQNIENKGPND